MPAVKPETDPPVRWMLTAREVAEQFDIAVSTLYGLIARGEFPKPVRIGRRMVRWDSTTLNEWIAGGCRPLK